MSGSLKLIYEAVKSKCRKDIIYWIPRQWTEGLNIEILEQSGENIRVEPYSFITARLEQILTDSNIDYRKPLSAILKLKMKNGKIIDGQTRRKPGDWLIGASIYGIYVRNFTAFDHNLDGELGGSSDDITLNSQGIKETGTFLKSITLLPYIKSLGFDTVYLLPVSMIGKAYKKGELGSPYAIRNPFKISPLFHDTLIDEYDQELEFRAFVEAAHALNMRVMLDFVPRTASRDSDFIKEHPDWFYWIERDKDAHFHSPEFSSEELREIHTRVERMHETQEREMIPPHDDYIAQFTSPPDPESVEYVNQEIGYVGKVNGKEVVVPGAFADWPPDDIQPPWTDVTYFKLYNDSQFNYVAYNTIRMYDGRISQKNQPLWDTIASFIPFYQEEFGIDGARIDMGHALPSELEQMIIRNARKIDPDFGFLSEDFNVWAQARSKGYNAVMGNFWFAFPRTMVAADNKESIAKQFIKQLPNYPNPVLGTPETTDTPRAASRKGGIKFSKAVWLLINTLPNMIPFCPAGFELGVNKPTNLGLDFTHQEIEAYSKKPLAFFDRDDINWDSPFASELIETIRRINRFRQENKGNILHLDNFSWLETDVEGNPFMSPNNPIISFLRFFEREMVTVLTTGIFGEVLYPIEIENDYLIVVNMDCENEVIATLMIDDNEPFENIYTGEKYKAVDGKMNLRLKPGEAFIAVKI